MKDLRKKLNKKGFTLIELIVVIAILAALAAIALPTMSGLIDQSKKQVAESNVRTIYTAAQSYAVTHDTETGTLNSSSTAFQSLVGEGMTGTYSAAIAAGNCTSATWIGAVYQSTYTPTQTPQFSTTKVTTTGGNS